MTRTYTEGWFSDTVKGNFSGNAGITITHNLDLSNYAVEVFPTENGEGAIGEIWITDIADNSFIVRNSGSATTEFTWVVYEDIGAKQGINNFTIVVLPDTQHYSQSYPDIFTKQTQWIVDHKSALNIKFVVHVGDIVNHGYSTTEWDNANTSMSLLDDKIPYLVIPGNHDYNDLCANSPKDASNYNTYFPYTRFEKYDWYRGHYPSNGNQNNYGFFSVVAEEFLVLGLEFCPTDAVLNWANNVISSYPNKKVIIFTHLYMYYDNTRVGSGYSAGCDSYGCCGDCNHGEDMWDNFVKKHSNIVLVTSGHIIGDGLGKRTDYVEGKPINQILQNYQFLPSGGNGWLRYYTFKPTEGRIEAKTYSPHLSQYNTSLDNEFILSYF